MIYADDTDITGNLDFTLVISKEDRRENSETLWKTGGPVRGLSKDRQTGPPLCKTRRTGVRLDDECAHLSTQINPVRKVY